MIFNELIDNIYNIAFFVLIVSYIQELFISEEYRKYVSFYCGLLLIIAIFNIGLPDIDINSFKKKLFSELNKNYTVEKNIERYDEKYIEELINVCNQKNCDWWYIY